MSVSVHPPPLSLPSPQRPKKEKNRYSHKSIINTNNSLNIKLLRLRMLDIARDMARAASGREGSRDTDDQHVARRLGLLAQVDLVAGGSFLEELAFGKELANLDEARGRGGEEAGGRGGASDGRRGAEGGAGEHFCGLWFWVVGSWSDC